MTTGVIDGIAWRADGSGPPVVLIHSGVTDHRMWDGVVGELVGSYTLIRYDLLGFGASPAPSGPFRHGDDLRSVLDHLDLAECAIVGNSLGGKLALDFCGAAPDRVTSLALLAPPIAGRDWSPSFREYGAAERSAIEAGDLDAAIRLNLDMWVRGPAREWSAPLRALADEVTDPMRTSLANQAATEALELDDEHPPVEDHLADLKTPTLVGIGDVDVPDFVSVAEYLAVTIPGAELVRFPGAGHLLPLERPGEVSAILRRFLG
jgi:pimeloyl-ACP methyl ester carboxylesterase